MTYELIPLTRDEANAFVERHHRHWPEGKGGVVGHRFAIGLAVDDEVIGVCIVGRPCARGYQDGWTAEVNRLCVLPGHPNACSKLYAAAWRAWRAMGGKRIVTYTLETEGGAA